MKKTALKMATAIITASLSTTLISCGKETDADKIADAQACLDKITSSSDATGIAQCKSLVEDISSTGAQAIRCYANFMREGFTNPSDIAAKLTDLDNGNTVDFMSAVTFTTEAAVEDNATNAKNTFQYCNESGGKGATIFSAFAYIPLAILETLNDGGGAGTPASCRTKPYNLADCITDDAARGASSIIVSNPGNKKGPMISALGQTVIATHRVSCANSETNSTLCTMLENAISNGGGTSNPSGVGQALLTDIATP